MNWAFLCAGLTAAAVTAALSPLTRFGPFWDQASGRSSHNGCASRSGGLAVAAGLGAGLCTAWAGGALVINADVSAWLGILGLAFGLGVLDDAKLLSTKTKFLGHVILAVLAAALLPPIAALPLPLQGLAVVEAGWVGPVLTGLWVFGFVNAFNFMDGMNGLVSGVAVMAGAVLAALLDTNLALLALLIAGAGFGFLPANLRGGVFLGDSGSHVLGFALAGLLPLMAGASDQGQAGTAWLVLPVLLLPLILDAAITFTARLISGAPVFQAHRSHLYQRLHRSGWAHGEVSALYMLATAVCAVPALLIHKAPSDGAGLLVASLAVCLGTGAMLHMRAIGFARA